jgi:hypothetical protein
MTRPILIGLAGMWLLAAGSALWDYARDRRYAKRHGVPLVYGCGRHKA